MEEIYMNNGGLNRNIFVGMLFGAFFGWVVGELLADHFAPEFYTEDELLANSLISEELLKDSATKSYVHKPYLESVKAYKPTNEEDEKPKVNYSRRYNKEEEKPPIEDLIAKYNQEPGEDPNDEDEYYEDEYYEDDIPEEASPEDILLDNRDGSEPHILLPEEFKGNESGLKQTTLFYYTEDDVLTDKKGLALSNPEKILGPDALLSFGLYYDDPNVIYVCNPKLGGEYEVFRKETSYTAFVNSGSMTPRVHHNVFDDQLAPSSLDDGAVIDGENKT